MGKADGEIVKEGISLSGSNNKKRNSIQTFIYFLFKSKPVTFLFHLDIDHNYIFNYSSVLRQTYQTVWSEMNKNTCISSIAIS